MEVVARNSRSNLITRTISIYALELGVRAPQKAPGALRKMRPRSSDAKKRFQALWASPKMAGPRNFLRWNAKYQIVPKLIKPPHNVELQFMLARVTGIAIGKNEKSHVRMSQTIEKMFTARPHLPKFQ